MADPLCPTILRRPLVAGTVPTRVVVVSGVARLAWVPAVLPRTLTEPTEIDAAAVWVLYDAVFGDQLDEPTWREEQVILGLRR